MAPGSDTWLEDAPDDGNTAASRRRALLFQLCSKDAVWRQGDSYLYCIIAAGDTTIQKAGKDYNKFFQMLFIQGIIDDSYVAGAYAKDDSSFEVRVSEPQLRQMREYYAALLRKLKS